MKESAAMAARYITTRGNTEFYVVALLVSINSISCPVDELRSEAWI